jgi:hypothetical protein
MQTPALRNTIKVAQQDEHVTSPGDSDVGSAGDDATNVQVRKLQVQTIMHCECQSISCAVSAE